VLVVRISNGINWLFLLSNPTPLILPFVSIIQIHCHRDI
jgi:hypothetical protein